jgi:DNA-binding NarL/FixJ family response regulator
MENDAVISIVYVDDSEEMRGEILEELVEQADFRLVGVGSRGEDAVELVQELEPDIALIDLDMPGMDGLEAARRLIEAGTRTKVLLYCFEVDLETREKVKTMGVAGLVEKGGNPWNFANSIRRVAAGEDI